jgi:Mn2+/Fe2+ NRAMP family transporter
MSYPAGLILRSCPAVPGTQPLVVVLVLLLLWPMLKPNRALVLSAVLAALALLALMALCLQGTCLREDYVDGWMRRVLWHTCSGQMHLATRSLAGKQCWL